MLLVLAMTQSDVKVVGYWPSPYVMRPRIALNIKSVEYEFLEETYGSKSELLLQTNPIHKKVPVLIHGDKPVCESLIIVEYIDETWSSGPPILPSDPLDRATARFWAAYIDEKWTHAMRCLRSAQGEEAKKAAAKKAVELLVLLEGVFHKASKGKAFFGGDEVGFLDIALGSFLGWIKVRERNYGVKLLGEDKTPGLVKWAQRFCSHEAVKSVMPDTDKLAEFDQAFVAKVGPPPSNSN